MHGVKSINVKNISTDCMRLGNNKLVLTKQRNFFFRLHPFVVPVIDLPLASQMYVIKFNNVHNERKTFSTFDPDELPLHVLIDSS